MTDVAPNAPLILVVDDDPAHLDSVATILRREGWRTAEASGGQAALELLRREQPAVLLTDLAMPGMDGTELMRAARTIQPELGVVLMTAFGTVESAVAAMKEGAYDFLVKPLKRPLVVKAISRALEKWRLLEENMQLRAKVAQLAPGGDVVGQSPAFRTMMGIVRQAAPSTATVLVIGPSGTGKELVARALHDLSPRSTGPFVPVNMAALPESIVESELFGSEKGAFTGATAKKGRFERADKGTLFLDEVGEMSQAVQVKLLRVIQEGEIERVGGTQPVKVDVRLVAATNRDLTIEMKEGRFRQDLYYRLNVVRIGVAPLRERGGDVLLLAHHFLRVFAAKNRKAVVGFTDAALAALERHDWPGNVRELENAIERAVVLGRDAQIDVGDLPDELRGDAPVAQPAARALVIPVGTPMDEIELRVIHETLRHTGGDKTLAAQLLGIATRTIYRKLGRERDEQAKGGEASSEAPMPDEPL